MYIHVVYELVYEFFTSYGDCFQFLTEIISRGLGSLPYGNEVKTLLYSVVNANYG